MQLPEIVAQQGSEFLLFSLTPPRDTVSPERAQEIADATVARLTPLGLDGLILYDIADESDRNTDERPFPFLPTMDPARYLERHLGQWQGPTVVYRAVGKYPETQLRSWLEAQDPHRTLTVFVGSPSRTTRAATPLRRAHEVHAEQAKPIQLGGVAIPERHSHRGTEHLRALAKQAAGCTFFVTQVVYDVNAAKDFVSDYFHECRVRQVRPQPIVFTFTVVGSAKTLEFLAWLGVHVPRWIQNEIVHAADPLAASSRQAFAAALDIAEFCRRLRVPFGCNVESVSNRRVEIEQAVALATQLRDVLR